MKTFKIFSLSLLMIAFTSVAFAQSKTEKITVAGECGTCKKKIEKAATTAGATYAAWNADTKELTVKYNSNSTNAAKIEQAISAVGYDTKNHKASDESYDKLDDCCKYERIATTETGADCCKGGKCEDCKDAKDAKCKKDMSCCKEGKCEHHSAEANEAKSGHSCCKKA
jgi:periplasmic mercuric ion binding protein